MARRIAVIQGHPDSTARHFCHALADEYAKGAEDGGHEVRRIDVATLPFPLLRTKEDFERGQPPEAIRAAQDTVAWADHLVVIYPLWLGAMPALLKGFFEQLLRPGFAFDYQPGGQFPQKKLSGKSARVVVTMGMPAFVYRWIFRAHGLKVLTRSILGFSGISPVKSTVIGTIEGMSERQRDDWLDEVRGLGVLGR
ncbi:MAG: NAD(P)H-dependent oxidoreductase [Nitrospira sp.]